MMDTGHMTALHLTLVGLCGWLPVLGTDYRQADLALLIDIWMVDFGLKCDLGGLEGVIHREDELNPKCSLVIWSAILGQDILQM